MSLKQIERDSKEYYEQTQALIFLEHAINRCQDVYPIDEVMRILEEHLDILEDEVVYERKSHRTVNLDRFTKKRT